MKKILLYILICFLVTSCKTGEKKRKISENYHQMAVSLIKKCDHPRALGHLLTGAKVDPQNFLIRYTLAVVYFTLKDYKPAIKHLKKVLKQNPKVTEARLTMARAYLELGKIDQAYKEIKRAEKDQTYSNPLKVIALRGLVYFKQGKWFKARREFKEYLSIPRNRNCFVTLHLGRTEMALNNLKESKKILKTALRICSNERPICSKKNYDSHYFLASLYLREKLKKQAAYHLKIFLNLASNSNPYVSQAKNQMKKIK